MKAKKINDILKPKSKDLINKSLGNLSIKAKFLLWYDNKLPTDFYPLVIKYFNRLKTMSYEFDIRGPFLQQDSISFNYTIYTKNEEFTIKIVQYDEPINVVQVSVYNAYNNDRIYQVWIKTFKSLIELTKKYEGDEGI